MIEGSLKNPKAYRSAGIGFSVAILMGEIKPVATVKNEPDYGYMFKVLAFVGMFKLSDFGERIRIFDFPIESNYQLGV